MASTDTIPNASVAFDVTSDIDASGSIKPNSV